MFMRILVLGGYGLIGLSIVTRLAEAGHGVTALGRSIAAWRRVHPAVSWVERNIAHLTHPEQWLPIVAGMDVVVNCAGALQDSPRDDLRKLQADAMRALFEACGTASVERVIQISAVGVSEHAPTAFFRTKAEADAALAGSDLDWVVFRPGLVIGPAAYGGTALARALASFPLLVPMIGGKQMIQTVGVGVIADAALAAAEGRIRTRQVYDLVEDQAHSFRDLILGFRAWLRFGPAPVVRVPAWTGRLLARVGDGLGHLGWRSPLRTTALIHLEQNLVGDPGPWRQETGHGVPPLSETLRDLPATVQERWFARLWLLKPLVIATLCLFWAFSGFIGIAQLTDASEILTERGFEPSLAAGSVLAGSVVDLALGLLVLVQRFHRAALIGMLATSVLYLAAGTVLAPDLWLDPLGTYLKVIPGAVLALVALAIAGER
jgi:uncharacterized protein YbjT (DUF2867 family)